MKYINVIKKEANLNLLKNIPNDLEIANKEYKGAKAPCIVKVDDSGTILKIYNTLDDFNISKQILEVQKVYIKKQVHNKYQSIIDNIKSQSTKYEIETWATQNAEWTAWNANNTCQTPFIDVLALSRGVDRAILLDKVGTKVLAVASILGQQQKVEDEINACATQDELDLIEV